MNEAGVVYTDVACQQYMHTSSIQESLHGMGCVECKLPTEMTMLFTLHDTVTVCSAAVSGCKSALGAVCLPGPLCSALGILWICDSAAANQVLASAILSEKQTAARSANGQN